MYLEPGGRSIALGKTGELDDSSQKRKPRGHNSHQEEIRFSESLWPGVDSACWSQSSRLTCARLLRARGGTTPKVLLNVSLSLTATPRVTVNPPFLLLDTYLTPIHSGPGCSARKKSVIKQVLINAFEFQYS